MEAGRDLDALIAEKVFGCNVEHQKIGTVAGWDSEPHCRCPGNPHEFSDRDYEVVELKRYSSDIASAWEVVEKLKSHMPSVQLTENLGDFYCLATFYKAEASADTAPLAICLAALKAVGDK